MAQRPSWKGRTPPFVSIRPVGRVRLGDLVKRLKGEADPARQKDWPRPGHRVCDPVWRRSRRGARRGRCATGPDRAPSEPCTMPAMATPSYFRTLLHPSPDLRLHSGRLVSTWNMSAVWPIRRCLFATSGLGEMSSRVLPVFFRMRKTLMHTVSIGSAGIGTARSAQSQGGDRSSDRSSFRMHLVWCKDQHETAWSWGTWDVLGKCLHVLFQWGHARVRWGSDPINKVMI